MTKIARVSPTQRATSGAAVPGVSNVAAAAPTRTCAYRSCRCQFTPPGWGRYCSQRCLERDFDEMDGVA